MTDDGADRSLLPSSSNPILRARRKKKVHRPVYADVFFQKPTEVNELSHVHLFVNPYSGKKKGERIGELAKTLLEEAGKTVEPPSPSQWPFDEIAQNLETPRKSVFAVVGGDGSLSEVITGRMKADLGQDDFAITPAGTGNPMANDLGISSTQQAVDAIVRGSYQNLDLAKVEMVSGLLPLNDDIWYDNSHNLVTLGVGVDSTIKAEKMRWMGPIRYDVGIPHGDYGKQPPTCNTNNRWNRNGR